MIGCAEAGKLGKRPMGPRVPFDRNLCQQWVTWKTRVKNNPEEKERRKERGRERERER